MKSVKKAVKRFAGALLATGIMLGSIGLNSSVAYAMDLGDSSQYCSNDLVQQLFTVARQTQEVLNLMNDEVIGYVNDDGSKGTIDGSRGDTSHVKYWVSGRDFGRFMDACSQYMYPVYQDSPAIYHYWQHSSDMVIDKVDINGDSNLKEIDGVWYLTSVRKDEMTAVVDGMGSALQPFLPILASAKDSKSSKDDGEKGHAHVHNFVEVVVQEATADSDKIVTMECTVCGVESSYVTVLGTAVNQFLTDMITKLQNAPANGSITIDTEIWTCFNRAAIDALKARQDVSVTVNFVYQGAKYSFTIPAGYGEDNLEALLDENGYCGFMYLLSVFGSAE